jgi:hypothetical protein
MDKESVKFWMRVKKVIKKTSKAYDGTWIQRKRVIDTEFLLTFIFKLVMSKNRQGYGSILIDMWNNYTQKGIKQTQSGLVSPSSVCEARQKLPEELFHILNQALIKVYESTDYESDWNGKRVFGIDGCRYTLPRELMEAGYSFYNAKKAYYPIGLCSCLYNLQTGITHDFELIAHKNERACAGTHLRRLQKNDIVVFDRGYFSYLLLHQYCEEKVDCVFRLQNGRINRDVQNFVNSHETDRVIRYRPSGPTKSEIKKQGHIIECKPISLRLIKTIISGSMVIYATTLLSETYSPRSIIDLYYSRWGIEELYKISKRSLEIESFHSKTERGVKQELFANFVWINIVRFFDISSAHYKTSKKETPFSDNDTYYRQLFCFKKEKLNFKNCLSVAGHFLEELMAFTSHKFTTHILPMILHSITRIRQKIRPNRHFKRCSHQPISKWINNRALNKLRA